MTSRPSLEAIADASPHPPLVRDAILAIADLVELGSFADGRTLMLALDVLLDEAAVDPSVLHDDGWIATAITSITYAAPDGVTPPEWTNPAGWSPWHLVLGHLVACSLDTSDTDELLAQIGIDT